MKITDTQYAKSLYEAMKDKSQSETDVMLGSFVKILAKNNQLKFKATIIQKFGKIYNKENGIVLAEVISREKLNSLLVDKLNRFIKSKYQAKEVIIENKIDENIRGGIIVKVGDEVMDASVEKQLKELKKNLIK